MTPQPAPTTPTTHTAPPPTFNIVPASDSAAVVAAGSNTTAGENTGVAVGQIVAVKKLILEVESDEFLQVCILHVLYI